MTESFDSASEPLVVVFLFHRQPPEVFQTTRGQLIARAIEAAAQSTLPGRPSFQMFDDAWALLTQDKRAAYHFPDLEAARRHIEHDRALTLYERGNLLSALDRLRRLGAS